MPVAKAGHLPNMCQPPNFTHHQSYSRDQKSQAAVMMMLRRQKWRFLSQRCVRNFQSLSGNHFFKNVLPHLTPIKNQSAPLFDKNQSNLKLLQFIVQNLDRSNN